MCSLLDFFTMCHAVVGVQIYVPAHSQPMTIISVSCYMNLRIYVDIARACVGYGQ